MTLSFLKPLAVIASASILLAGCQTHPFSQQPQPEPRYIPKLALGEVQTLVISPTKVPCDSELPMLCLIAEQVSGDKFQIPYNWIEGFNHTAGVEYTIRVQPMVDQNDKKTTGHWVLQDVVSQQQVNN